MQNHITHPQGRDSYTLNNFTWRFFSCQNATYYTVVAHSEREARDQLPDAPCLFAARFCQEVRHA